MQTSSAEIPRVSVLMPIFGQCQFIRRALDSLLAQTLADWELIVIDDGSRDDTAQALRPYLQDPRIHLISLPVNTGLGNALNCGLDRARARLIAYLPSDDLYYSGHLQQLSDCLKSDGGAILASSGMRHHYNRESQGPLPGVCLQLVQCMHRRTPLRWTAREELESDDLARLFWSRLQEEGDTVCTGQVSCEWADHPAQRHKLMQEPVGGINLFRRHYGVQQPLHFHTTVGNDIDEAALYRHQRERPPTPLARDGLKILLVGELAYNPDRVLALEEAGHQLFGLWMGDPYWYNTVGPVPFGHVQDLSSEDWRAEIARVQPDVIYALLNWQAVPFAHEVLMARLGIPFVWHFKEGPFICMEKGSWPKLIDLTLYSDGCIFSSPEMRDWFDTVIPDLSRNKPCHILDGDLPKRDWFTDARAPLLSASDGEIHTVVPGRPIGLHPHTVADLARQRMHLHFYGDFTHGQWRKWIDDARTLAPRHLHLHANIDQRRWVREFSQYDAGWLHAFQSTNQGDIRRAIWDDLNYPARIATLAAAGLPMIQRDNTGALVATQTLAREHGIGVFFNDEEELGTVLHDRAGMQRIRERVWEARDKFTFDHHVPDLLRFFRQVIDLAR